MVPFLCEIHSLCSDPLQPAQSTLPNSPPTSSKMTPHLYQGDLVSILVHNVHFLAPKPHLCRECPAGKLVLEEALGLKSSSGFYHKRKVRHIFILSKPVFSYYKMGVIELFPRTVGRISTTVRNPVSATQVWPSLCPTLEDSLPDQTLGRLLGLLLGPSVKFFVKIQL